MNPENSQINSPSTDTTVVASSGYPFKWLLFLTVLVSPTLLTTLVVLLGADKGDAAPVIAFFSSVISGIICGAMIACWMGKTLVVKILLSVVFIAIAFAVCLVMSCVGCAASGYKLNFH